nr:uncharacterized protein LOC114826763 [Malus domestica]
MVSSKLGSAKLMPSPVKIDKSSSRINPVVRESEVPTVCSGARAYASNETLRLQPGFDGFATQSARISHNQEKEKRKTIFLDQPPQPPMAASDTRPSKKMRVPVGVDSTKGENSGKKADVVSLSVFSCIFFSFLIFFRGTTHFVLNTYNLIYAFDFTKFSFVASYIQLF